MKIVIILVVLVGGAAAALFVTPLGQTVGLVPAPTEQTAVEGGPLPVFKLKDRVINLSDAPDPSSGKYRYAKIAVAFEYTGKGVYEFQKAPAAERTKAEEKLNKKIEEHAYALNDALTTIVGSKRTDEILGPGRERLRKEIQDAFENALKPDYHIVKIYLLELIVQ